MTGFNKHQIVTPYLTWAYLYYYVHGQTPWFGYGVPSQSLSEEHWYAKILMP
ncbi:MAG: hypothetical protein N3A66_02610 [Planctomycetota bacterium]|nr:hypothetical protein [Planctomycetota bacterium]